MGRENYPKEIHQQEECCNSKKVIEMKTTSFLKYLNIGDDSSKHKRGFTDAGDIADWFRNDRPDDWRQRD